MNKKITTSDPVFTNIAEKIAATAEISLEKIKLKSQLQNLGMDSLDALALMSDLEAEYKIKIPNQELLKIKTVEQAVESIKNRIA